MGARAPKKSGKRDTMNQVAELARGGCNDSEIGRRLGIHRTTVKRYREQIEKGAIGREARIRVVQESLSRHFDDLCQVCERLRDGIRSDEPERALVEDLQTSRILTKVPPGRRGHAVEVILKVAEGKVKIDRLSIEGELTLVSLKQHMRNSDLWRLLGQWKELTGEYMSALSCFYGLLEAEARHKTKLPIVEIDHSTGLTSYFAHTIYKDVCGHAFFGYQIFRGAGYAINTLSPDWHELRFCGLPIALADDRDLLEECRKVHGQMMKHFRNPSNQPVELQRGIHLWPQLKELEAKIDLVLQKLILKRTFPGRCDLCPD
jgi:DNA-binding CsgD family transcriptional regulator